VQQVVWLNNDRLLLLGNDKFAGVFQYTVGDGGGVPFTNWQILCGDDQPAFLSIFTSPFDSPADILYDFHSQTQLIAYRDETHSVETDRNRSQFQPTHQLTIATIIDDGEIAKHESLRAPPFDIDNISSAQISPSGRLLAIGTEIGELAVMETTSVKLLPSWSEMAHVGNVAAIAFGYDDADSSMANEVGLTPSDSVLYSAAFDSRVLRWSVDMETGLSDAPVAVVTDDTDSNSWFYQISPTADGGILTLDDELGARFFANNRSKSIDLGERRFQSTRAKNLITPAFPDGRANNAFPIAREFPLLVLQELNRANPRGSASLASGNDYSSNQFQVSFLFDEYALNDPLPPRGGANDPTQMSLALRDFLHSGELRSDSLTIAEVAIPSSGGNIQNFSATAVSRFEGARVNQELVFAAVERDQENDLARQGTILQEHTLHLVIVSKSPIIFEDEDSSESDEVVRLQLRKSETSPDVPPDNGTTSVATRSWGYARHIRCRFTMDGDLTGFSVAPYKLSEIENSSTSIVDGDAVQIVLSSEDHLKYMRVSAKALAESYEPAPVFAEDYPECTFLKIASRRPTASLTISDDGQSLIVLDTDRRVTTYDISAFLKNYLETISSHLILTLVSPSNYEQGPNNSSIDDAEIKLHFPIIGVQESIDRFFSTAFLSDLSEAVEIEFEIALKHPEISNLAKAFYENAPNDFARTPWEELDSDEQVQTVFEAMFLPVFEELYEHLSEGEEEYTAEAREQAERLREALANQIRDSIIDKPHLTRKQLRGESRWYQYNLDQPEKDKASMRWLDWILNTDSISFLQDPRPGELFVCLPNFTMLGSETVGGNDCREDRPVWNRTNESSSSDSLDTFAAATNDHKPDPSELIVQFVSSDMLMITQKGGIILQELPQTDGKRRFGQARWFANRNAKTGDAVCNLETGIPSWSEYNERVGETASQCRGLSADTRLMKSAILIEESAQLISREWGVTPAHARPKVTLIGFDSSLPKSTMLELARADVLDAAPYPALRNGVHLLMTLMSPVFIIATFISIMAYYIVSVVFRRFDEKQHGVSGIAGDLNEAGPGEDRDAKTLRIAIDVALFLGTLLVCLAAAYFLWMQFPSSEEIVVGKCTNDSAFSFGLASFQINGDCRNLGLFGLTLLVAIIIFVTPLLLVRFVTLIRRVMMFVESERSGRTYRFLQTAISLPALLILIAVFQPDLKPDIDLWQAKEFLFVGSVLIIGLFIWFTSALKILLTVGFTVVLPVLFLNYALGTLGDPDFRLNALRTELLFGLGMLGLFSIWFRSLMVGLTLSLLMLPLTIVGFSELVSNGAQSMPEGTFLLELDKLYAVIIFFSALTLLTNIAFSFLPSKYSFGRLPVFGVFAVALFIWAYGLDGESMVLNNIYLIWAFALIILIAILAGIGWTVTKSFLVPIMADTARYLGRHPKDVALSRRVRADGVQMLEALHASGRYDRVVIVAHSLGSIVGLDIVSRFWARRAERMTPLQKSTYQAAIADVAAIQDAAFECISNASSCVAQAVPLSRSARRAIERHENNSSQDKNDNSVLETWLKVVQDLDLLFPSPGRLKKKYKSAKQFKVAGAASFERHHQHLLDYAASFRRRKGTKNEESADLLEIAAGELEQAATKLEGINASLESVHPEFIRQTSLGDRTPLWLISDFITIGSPLTYGEWLLTEQRHADYPKTVNDKRGENGNGSRQNLSILPCKWTNLFFETRWIVLGDIIAGPLWRKFGIGVKDVVLTKKRPNFQFFAHNEYWKLDHQWIEWLADTDRKITTPEHVDALQNALSL